MKTTSGILRLDYVSRKAIVLIFTRPIAFSIVILAIFAASLGTQWLYDWWESFTIVELLLGILAVSMPFVAAMLYRKMYSLLPAVKDIVDMPSEQVTEWFRQQTASIFGSKWTYLAIAFLCITGIASTDIVGIPWSGIVRVLFYLFSAIFFAMTAIVAWTYLGLLVFLLRLVNQEIKGAPFDWPEKQFAHLNQSYLDMFAVGVAIYIVAVVAVWSSPGGPSIALHNPLAQLWIFPVAGTVVGFFLSFQYLIHRIILRSKQHRLDKINQLLGHTFDAWMADLAPDKAKAVTELMSWRDRIREESDWPLDLRSTLTITSGLLLPAARTILDLISSLLRK
jgi:hypothetical protein